MHLGFGLHHLIEKEQILVYVSYCMYVVLNTLGPAI